MARKKDHLILTNGSECKDVGSDTDKSFLTDVVWHSQSRLAKK
jgi:hypothetical protein